MSVTYLVVTIVGYQLFKSGRIFEKKVFCNTLGICLLL